MSIRFAAASNQKLEIPGPVQLTANRTFLIGMCWVKLNSTDQILNDMDLFQYSTGTSLTQSRFAVTLIAGANGRLQVKGRAADSDSLSIFSPLVFTNFDTWRHVAGAIDYERGRGYLWVDGQPTGFGAMGVPFSATQTAATPSLHGRIGGGLTDPTQGVDGVQEDVRLYSSWDFDLANLTDPPDSKQLQTIFALRGKDSIVKTLLHRYPLKDVGSGAVVTVKPTSDAERIVATSVNSPVWSDESIISFQKIPPRINR